MAAQSDRRRPMLRGRQNTWSSLKLLAASVVPLVALALAPVALAQPAARPAGSTAGLLPSVLPSVCVGGILLCPGSLVTLPTPLPAPLPSVCVSGIACTSEVVVPPGPPTAAPPLPPTAPVSGPGPPRPGGALKASQRAGPVALQPLPAPPGVGLVPPPPGRPVPDSGLSPDAFASLVSLSLRDGLGSARYHVWPWLLAIQLVLWTSIAVVGWSLQLTAAARARRG